MLDEWRKFYMVVGIAVLAGLARAFTSGERRSFWRFVNGLFLAGFVGAMTALALSHTEYSEGTKGFIIGLSSFAGEDLLTGALKISRDIGASPKKIIKRIVDSFLG